jgi:hypothetical protein
VSKKAMWTGYVMSALPVLALVMSAVMKFMKPAPVVQGFAHLGYLESAAFNLGVLEIACTVVYLIPQTSVLGAILLTGYLGGATASTFRVGDPWIMTVALGILIWGGLFMRDPRLRALIPIRKNPA